MIDEIDPYVRSGEINSKVNSVNETIAKVCDAFKNERQDTIDGLTVFSDKFWFNLRPSNTEPLLRLNVEADNKIILEEKIDMLLKIIRQ